MVIKGFLLFLAQSASEAVASGVAASGDVATEAPKGFMDSLGKNGMLILLLPVALVLMMTMGGGNRKKQKQMKQMLSTLEKGDKIQTIGGIIGTVFHVKENSVVVAIDSTNKMEFAVSAVSTVIEKKNAPKVEQSTAQGGILGSIKSFIGGGKKSSGSEINNSDSKVKKSQSKDK